MRRHALFAGTLIACVLLVIAEFSDLNTVRIGTTTRPGLGVGENHSHALVIVAVVAAGMGFAAWAAASRAAAMAVAALGAAALLIVIAVDGPDVDQRGTFARDYADVTASAAIGFRLELIGAILLLLMGVLTSVWRSPPSAARASAS